MSRVFRCDMTWAFGCQRTDCLDCDTQVLEAWERQTTGGLKVPCLPGYPYAHAVDVPVRAGHTGFTRFFMSPDGRKVVHTQYCHDID